jgi:molybdopterin molybdotransferase
VISVAEARARILSAFSPLPPEMLGLSQAMGRVLARPLLAARTQPPWPVAAMDGWAVRAVDVGGARRTDPVALRRIGEAAAGRAFDGTVGPGEAVRIFTGAPVPDGADCVVMQEDCTASGDEVRVGGAGGPGRHVRPAGVDFAEGRELLAPGRLLSARDIMLAAAADRPWLAVHRRPRIAILSTGDELVAPGEAAGPSQIVNSNAFGVAGLVTALGGEAVDLGIALDTPASLAERAAGARGCDLLVTIGGASDGDHDLVKAVLGRLGVSLDFYKIAMRPGKPLMFGRGVGAHGGGGVPLLGLPGNPVSAMVCAVLFLQPLLRVLQGLPADHGPPPVARLAVAVKGGDARQDHLRATLERQADGTWLATPFAIQDSAIISLLARADALIVRPPHCPPAAAGDAVEIIPFPGPFPGGMART